MENTLGKAELINLINEISEKLDKWEICLNENNSGQYKIGYYYDINSSSFIVYQNNEHGRFSWWSFDKEEDALKKLYARVKYRYDLMNC